MRRFPSAALVLGLALGSTACGAIFNGSRQDVRAQSSPDGASLAIEPVGSASPYPRRSG